MDHDVATTNFDRLVSSFEHYTRFTNFPNILCNSITSSVAAPTGNASVNTLLTNLAKIYTTYTALQDVVAPICSSLKTFLPDTNSQIAWLFYNDNTTATSYISSYNSKPFCNQVAAIYATQMPPIEKPAATGNDAYPVVYRSNMRTVFDNVFLIVYGQLKDGYCNAVSGSSCTPILNTVSTTALKTLVNTVINSIDNEVYTLLNKPGSNYSIEFFLNQVLKYLTVTYPLANGSSSLTTIHYNLVFTCYMPYFCFLYVAAFLPTPRTVSTNKAPRSGATRGIAILTMYKFIMYTIYGTYKMIASYNPASPDALLLRQAIDINVISLFNAEYSKFSQELGLSTSSVQNTISKIGTLEESNQQIVMARSNALNISNNEVMVTRALNSAKKVKWVWISVLITYIIAFAAIFVLYKFKILKPENGMYNLMMHIFLGISATIFIVLCILGLVAVF